MHFDISNLAWNDLKRMHHGMMRIRMLEEAIEDVYHLDEMKTPVHLCIGQEAVPTGVCQALDADDYVFGTHRGHGHYLARGGDMRQMVAEFYGRKPGCSGGHGGSMHLVDRSVGYLGSSAIIGGAVPLAVGVALGIRMRGEQRVSTVFFGDGAADEGVIYESINFAVLRQLPVLFVLENNQYAVCSARSKRQSWKNYQAFSDAYGIDGTCVDGNNVIGVFRAADRAVQKARKMYKPALIECRTYRWRGHAGAFDDAHPNYRSDEELDQWHERCPIRHFEAFLLARGILSTETIDYLKQEIRQEIEDAFRFALEAPLPDPDQLIRNTYATGP